MPSWKKVIVSGSDASLNSLNVINGITGSLLGTSSYASNADLLDGLNSTAFVLNSQTSSFTTTSSFNAYTSSINTYTSSLNSKTSSFATTGSNNFNGNQNITGSLTISSSAAIDLNVIGGQNITGSLNVSGSQTFIGTQTVTGSLLVSGSTTQIGNNTLTGNTSLSGSLTISGSQGSATPTINIFGDINQTGYTKYLPVTSNIDNSISASYIYVSGSTSDLYFTQNGNGYSNTSRLRWLESNLYTGLLSGGVVSASLGSTSFTISSGSALIVSLGASTSSIDPYPTARRISWNTVTTPLYNSGSAKITYVGIDGNGAVVQQTVPWGSTDITQWDTQVELGVVLHLSGSVVTGIYNSPQISYGQSQQADDFIRAFGPVKISGHTLQVSGSSPTLSIKKTAGTAYNRGSNYVNNPNHPSTVSDPAANTSKIYRYYISGSTPVIDTGVANAGYTTIDNLQYVNTSTGALTSVGNSNWSIQRVFWIPNSPTNAFLVYYGNGIYPTLLDAVNAKDTEVFTEAPNTAANAIFLGYIIVEGGAGRDLLNSDEATIIQGGLFRAVGGVGSSGTTPISTTLESLADVSIPTKTAGDLLYYNGASWINSKGLTGNYSITGSLSVSSAITANLTGTASFTTTASYANNADLLDGLNSSVFTLNSQTSSFVLNSQTSSFVQNSQTGAFATFTALNAYTSSINTYTSSLNSATGAFSTFTALNAYTSSINTYTSSLNSKTSSFATTGSNNFNGNQTITGSLLISSSASTNLTVVGNSIFTGSLTISGSSVSGALSIDCLTPATSYGSLTIKSTTSDKNNAVLSLISTATSSNFYVTGSSIDFWGFQTDDFPFPSGIYKNSFIQDANYSLNFGSLNSFKWNTFNLGYTGSTAAVDGFGALTGNPIGTNLLTLNTSQLSSSVAVVAPSFTGNLTGTASFASNALSASYARSASLATTADVATTIAVVNNTGDATRYLVWAATGAGNRTPNITTQRFVVNSATGSMGINKSTIASGYILDVGGNALISGSLTIFSGSAIDFQVTDTGTKIGNAPSDNHTVTGSLLLSGSLTSTGTITAQTLIVQTVSSSVIYSSGSNRFGNDLANTQVLTGSVIITGSLSVNGSNAVLTNQTSSFVLNSQTSSFVQNSQTSSFATFTALNAYTSSINTYTSSLNSATGAFATFTALNAYTSSINTYTSSINAKTSSFATTGSNNFIGTENITGSLNVSGSTTFTGTSGTTLLSTNADTLIFTGSLYTSGAASLSGSISISGSLSVNGSNVILTNQTGAFTLNSQTSSFVLNSQTSSMSVLSASFAATSSKINVIQNPGAGQYAIIFAALSGAGTGSQQLAVTGSDFSYEPQSGRLNVQNLNGTASLATTASYANYAELLDGLDATQFTLTSSFNPYTSSINSYTSSLNTATSSFVLNSQTSSFVQNSQTGAFATFTALNAYTSSLNNFSASILSYTASQNNLNGTYATTSSLNAYTSSINTYTSSLNSVTSSFVKNSQTSSMSVLSASYAATASLADTASFINVSGNALDALRYPLFVATGVGVRTANISTNRIVANGATGSLGLGKGSITSGYYLDVAGSVLISGSLVVTGSTVISSSLTIFSGSAIDFQVTDTGTKIGNAPSDNHTVTGSLLLSGSLTSTGTITAQTLIVQTVTSSVIYSSGSNVFGNSLANTQVFTGSVIVTGSLSVNGSNAVLTNQTSSFTLNSQTSSFATTGSNTFNGNQIITGSLTVGSSSLGPNENTITLGARDNANEGGQIGFNAPGGTFASASFIDNWSNFARILRGTNASSNALVAQWNLGTLQMELPGYTSVSSFAGTAAANLAVDSSGKVITVSTSGGSVFPYVGNAVITGSLTATTGLISPVNGGAYLRGGDDAELWDINVTNTVGLYGQQDQTVGSLKLGSGGGTISGKTGFIGINTIAPLYALDINASGSTGARVYSGSLAVGNITPSATVGRIDASNDVVAFSTSDIRFKENINPIDNALEKLDQIGGYTFDWKTEEELVSLHGFKGHDVGIIAQEIESILPEVVTTRDSGYKAVKYEKIVPLLIQAIKEQQEQIKELQDIIKNK